MSASFKLAVKKNAFKQIGKRIEVALAEAVRETARQVRDAAKAKAPVRSGALRASIYAVYSGHNGYTAAMSNAGRLLAGYNAKQVGKSVYQQEKSAGQSSSFARSAGSLARKFAYALADRTFSHALSGVSGADRMTAFVAVGADYGVFLEFGTVKSPAQPFFLPAVEGKRRFFRQQVREALQKT